MSGELIILLTAAASIGFFHTLLGPDHYLPFIVMSRSGKWSVTKTTVVTFLCGLGHVLSSVILGMLGIILGIAVSQLEAVETLRGGIASWALIAFGLVYFIWGVRRALKNKPHQHLHIHGDGLNHEHVHVHTREHVHVHGEKGKNTLTPWILFTIFLFGPCEPLIPLLMYPAAKSSFSGLLLVTGIFGTVTILTMLSIVLVSTSGMNLLPTTRLERYTHAIAGATICLCGIAIKVLGL
jgi:sulfite exporter TauE/SafE